MSADLDDTAMPLVEHLTELRTRLIRAFIVIGVLFVAAFFVAEDILNILIVPYQWGAGTEAVRFVFIRVEGILLVYIKLALFVAVFLAFPVLSTEIYKFVAPGLYKNERAAFLPFLFATPVLFVLGAMLVYFLVMPLATAFLLSQQQFGLVTIENLPDVEAYLSLIMKLFFAFGFVFQLPVVLTLMARAGLVTSEGLKAKWKWAIILTFLFAAFLTPPDVISQLGLALPTLLLYQLSIYSARLVERKRAEREAEYE